MQGNEILKYLFRCTYLKCSSLGYLRERSFSGSFTKSLRTSLARDFWTSLQYGVWNKTASKYLISISWCSGPANKRIDSPHFYFVVCIACCSILQISFLREKKVHGACLKLTWQPWVIAHSSQHHQCVSVVRY